MGRRPGQTDGGPANRTGDVTMTTVLWGILILALLLCALKLSLVERLWEAFPSAAAVAAAPLLLHRFAVRASLLEVERTLGAPETLTTFSALLALEAILSLGLVAAVLTAHADSAARMPVSSAGRCRVPYGAAAAAALVLLLIGRLTAYRTLEGAGFVVLGGVLAWPWLPRGLALRPARGPGAAASVKAGALLITPLWALLSPAGLAAIAGMHLHLLHAVSGTDLWRLTLFYAAALFAVLVTVAVALRFTVRAWRLRLDGVMLLAFLLLMAAMFVPQLFSKTPPPASTIQVNWPATAAIALLGAVVAAAGMRWHTRRAARTG